MAPACVLLDCTVDFRDHPLAGVVGGTTRRRSSSEPIPSVDAIEAEIARYMRAMTPDLQVVDPPGVSCLTIVRPHPSHPFPELGYAWSEQSGMAVAADKNLVLIYVGSYRPISKYGGCYLLVDTASSSLSRIPGVHHNSFPYSCVGAAGAVIMAREGGSFVLAELLFKLPSPAEPGVPGFAKLCLWQRSEWVYRVGRLPAELRHTWRLHKSFSVQSRNLLCWVDLLHGLLLCDLGRNGEVDSPDLGMSFVPLPHSCSIGEHHHRRLIPQDFCTMACVDGTIKFLTMEGFVERNPIALVTFALDLDGPSPTWMKDTVLRLDDLWADKTLISKGVPRITPLFPMLSTQEHDVVYLVIGGRVDDVEGYKVERAQLLLSVDMRKAMVISATQDNSPRTLLRWRRILVINAS
jgi:hypothetical protein